MCKGLERYFLHIGFIIGTKSKRMKCQKGDELRIICDEVNGNVERKNALCAYCCK